MDDSLLCTWMLQQRQKDQYKNRGFVLHVILECIHFDPINNNHNQHKSKNSKEFKIEVLYISNHDHEGCFELIQTGEEAADGSLMVMTVFDGLNRVEKEAAVAAIEQLVAELFWQIHSSNFFY